MLTNIADTLSANKEITVIMLLVCLLLLIIMSIVSMVNMRRLSIMKQKYNAFMAGADGESLEQSIQNHIDEIDGLLVATRANRKDIDALTSQIKYTFQKVGLVKYDAFQEMGGKLSFSLCILNEKNDGFIINAMHSREGCYTYIKEVIAGKSIILLSEEETEALNMAKEYKD